MRRILLAITLFCGAASAQWTDFTSSTASSVLIGAMNGKLNWQTGSGNPNGSFAGTAGKDAFLDSTNLVEYICTVTGTTSTAVWKQLAMATETWTVGTGGVTANTCVQMDTSNPSKIIAGTTSCYGIAVSTVSAAGSVEVTRSPYASCVTDTGGSTAGDLAIQGTGTAIDCKDSGQTTSSAISIGTRIIGVFRQTVTAGNPALIELTPSHFGTKVDSINGTSLAGLATGLLKNTTTTGVPSIAATGTDYQAPITLTTTGTSGAATFTSGTLNIPQYTGGSNPFSYHAYTGTAAFDFSTYTDVLNTASGANPIITVSTNPATAGLPVNIGLCNDTTARSWTLPSTFKRIGFPAIASTCVYTPATWDGTNYQGPGTDEPPSVIRLTTERAAPATPAASTGVLWPDSTDHDFEYMANNSASLFKMFLAGADCNPVTGVCTKTNGSAFGTSATVNTGTSGATIPLNNGNNTSSGNDSYTGSNDFSAATWKIPNCVSSVSSATNMVCNAAGVVHVWTGSDNALGTAAFVNTGTSGANLGLLNGNLTFSGSNAYGTPASITLTNATGLPNAGLVNTATTVNGATCTLGSACAPYGGVVTYTANHTVGAADIGKLVVMNCTSTCALTFKAAPAATDWFGVETIGSTVATVSLNSLNYNGASSVPVLNNFRDMRVASDGSNYFGDAPLVAGTNVTITPASNGATIAASGGGGGGGTPGSTYFTYVNSTGVGPNNTATETSLIGTATTGSKTIPANTFTAGALTQFQVVGQITTPAAPDNLTLNMYMGATKVATGTVTGSNIDSLTTQSFVVKASLFTLTGGASCAFVIEDVSFLSGGLVAGDLVKFQGTGTTFDCTATQAFDFKAQWAGAQSGESIFGMGVALLTPGTPAAVVGSDSQIYAFPGGTPTAVNPCLVTGDFMSFYLPGCTPVVARQYSQSTTHSLIFTNSTANTRILVKTAFLFSTAGTTCLLEYYDGTNYWGISTSVATSNSGAGQHTGPMIALENGEGLAINCGGVAGVFVNAEAVQYNTSLNLKTFHKTGALTGSTTPDSIMTVPTGKTALVMGASNASVGAFQYWNGSGGSSTGVIWFVVPAASVGSCISNAACATWQVQNGSALANLTVSGTTAGGWMASQDQVFFNSGLSSAAQNEWITVYYQ